MRSEALVSVGAVVDVFPPFGFTPSLDDVCLERESRERTPGRGKDALANLGDMIDCRVVRRFRRGGAGLALGAPTRPRAPRALTIDLTVRCTKKSI